VTLLEESFGPDFFPHVALVFNRANGGMSPERARLHAADIAGKLSKITGRSVSTFPVFQLDTQVESRAGSTPEYILERKAANARAMGDLAAWVRKQQPISTIDFKVGMYEEMKQLREKQEKLDAAKAAEAAAEAARQVAERERAEADQRARDAEARERSAKETFFSLTKGFKIKGMRIW
jgi:hypothetical protein